MKKADIIITATVLLVAVILTVSIFFLPKRASKVIIKEDNKITHTLPLYKNQTIELEGNTVVIKNGEVDVTEASCKNQICVNTKKASKKGESIVCLPNRVIVEVK